MAENYVTYILSGLFETYVIHAVFHGLFIGIAIGCFFKFIEGKRGLVIPGMVAGTAFSMFAWPTPFGMEHVIAYAEWTNTNINIAFNGLRWIITLGYTAIAGVVMYLVNKFFFPERKK